MSRKRTTLPTILNSKSNVSDWYRVLFPWKRLTAKSKSGHCSQEQNAAPNTVTHNSKYTNYTLYFVFTEIKKIIRGHSLGCILGWAVPMVIFFPVPFLCFSPERQTLYRKYIKALTLWCLTCFHIKIKTFNQIFFFGPALRVFFVWCFQNYPTVSFKQLDISDLWMKPVLASFMQR